MSCFSGLAAFPITPADRHGVVETQSLQNIVDRLRLARVDCVGLLGSTGIYAYLSRSERRRAIEAARECLQGQVPLMVSASALRTDDAQALARDAQLAGADALLLAPVSYTPLSEEEVFQHVVAVASVTDLPLCIYNNPGTTHFTFSPALLARLAALDKVQAVKNPAPEAAQCQSELAALKSALPADFSLGVSGDWRAAEALLAGAQAWYSVIGGLLPVPTLQLARAALAGDRLHVSELSRDFEPLWRLFQELSSIRVMYAAANLLGLTQAEPPRPVLALNTEQTERVAQVLASLT